MKYGFIGCGNMGGALARALTKTTQDVIISDPSPFARELAAEMGCEYGSNELAASCDRVFLAVKPNILGSVLAGIRPILKSRKPLLISMAAGVSIEQIESFAGTELPVIRIMPNTPAAVGKGMITYAANELVDEATVTDFLRDIRWISMLFPSLWRDAHREGTRSPHLDGRRTCPSSFRDFRMAIPAVRPSPP